MRGYIAPEKHYISDVPMGKTISVKSAEDFLTDFDFRDAGQYLEEYVDASDLEIDWNLYGEELFLVIQSEGTVYSRTARHDLLRDVLWSHWEDFLFRMWEDGKLIKDDEHERIPEEAFDAYVVNRLVRFLQKIGWDDYFDIPEMLQDVERVLGWAYLD